MPPPGFPPCYPSPCRASLSRCHTPTLNSPCVSSPCKTFPSRCLTPTLNSPCPTHSEFPNHYLGPTNTSAYPAPLIPSRTRACVWHYMSILLHTCLPYTLQLHVHLARYDTCHICMCRCIEGWRVTATWYLYCNMTSHCNTTSRFKLKSHCNITAAWRLTATSLRLTAPIPQHDVVTATWRLTATSLQHDVLLQHNVTTAI